MGAHSTQKLIEFRSTKIDEGLPILRAFCGSAIISNDLRSHRKILRRTLPVTLHLATWLRCSRGRSKGQQGVRCTIFGKNTAIKQ